MLLSGDALGDFGLTLEAFEALEQGNTLPHVSSWGTRQVQPCLAQRWSAGYADWPRALHSPPQVDIPQLHAVYSRLLEALAPALWAEADRAPALDTIDRCTRVVEAWQRQLGGSLKPEPASAAAHEALAAVTALGELKFSAGGPCAGGAPAAAFAASAGEVIAWACEAMPGVVFCLTQKCRQFPHAFQAGRVWLRWLRCGAAQPRRMLWQPCCAAWRSGCST